MKLYQIISALSLLLPFATGGAVRSSSTSRRLDDQGIQLPGGGIGGGGGIGNPGNRPECTFRGEPPFITEEYLIFRFDGEFDFGNLTDVIALDTAFVTAYGAFVNCSSVPGSERDMFDSEFLQVDFNSSTFLLRAGYFCNSCNEFRNVFNETCRETNGPEAPYQIDVYVESLFSTSTPPEEDECACTAPDSEDVVALFNELLDYPGFEITGSLQLCPQLECDRQQSVTTYTLADGVCLAIDLLPLTAAPSEFPSQFPSEFPSEEPTSTDDPTNEPTPDPTPEPTDATGTPTVSPPTDAPVAPTDAPVAPTDAPVAPTDAPVAPTDAPVDPTDAPVDPTDAPVDPTEAPVDPTEAPVDPTEAPVDPTEAPVDPTEAPVDPTEAPQPDPTEAPQPDPTAAPVP